MNATLNETLVSIATDSIFLQLQTCDRGVIATEMSPKADKYICHYFSMKQTHDSVSINQILSLYCERYKQLMHLYNIVEGRWKNKDCSKAFRQGQIKILNENKA